MARVLGAGLALWLADRILTGIAIQSFEALVVGTAVLALAHAAVRPILRFFTFPLTLLTLGGSLWVINAGLLYATGWLVPGMDVRGVLPALGGALVISIAAGGTQLLLEADGGSGLHRGCGG